MAASGLTTNYNIPYPVSTDPVSVSADMESIAQRIDELFATIPQLAVDQATNSSFQIIPLDDISYQFDNIENTFVPRYQGDMVSITNPYRLMVTLDGLQQKFLEPEYVFQSPMLKSGFMVDYDGNLRFSPIPTAGESFDAKVLPGATTPEYRTMYPFNPMDILMGG